MTLLLAGWWHASPENCFCPGPRSGNKVISNEFLNIEWWPEETKMSVLKLCSFCDEVEVNGRDE